MSTKRRETLDIAKLIVKSIVCRRFKLMLHIILVNKYKKFLVISGLISRIELVLRNEVRNGDRVSLSLTKHRAAGWVRFEPAAYWSQVRTLPDQK